MDSLLPHRHKHYFADTKIIFEPVAPEEYGDPELYRRVEYAILMCNSPCNDVKKVIVKKETEISDY